MKSTGSGLHKTYFIDVPEDDIVSEIVIDDIKRFKAKNKSDDEEPMAKVGMYLQDRLGIDLKASGLSVSNIVVGPKTYDQISRYMEGWARKRLGKGYTGSLFEKQWTFYNFDRSPVVAEVKEGVIFLRGDLTIPDTCN